MCFALCYSCTRKISVNEGSSTDCSDFLLGLQLELLDKFRTLEGGWLPLLPVDVIDSRGTLLAGRLDCELAGRLSHNIIFGERLKHDLHDRAKSFIHRLDNIIMSIINLLKIKIH